MWKNDNFKIKFWKWLRECCCFILVEKSRDSSVGINGIHVCLENLNSELGGCSIKVINN